jgi:hypothetical protein
MSAARNSSGQQAETAQGMDSASGAIIEPSAKAVDTNHPSIDGGPRAGTSATQNARDMNDPHRRRPNDRDFEGQGIDPTPYGKKAAPKKSKARK